MHDKISVFVRKWTANKLQSGERWIDVDEELGQIFDNLWVSRISITQFMGVSNWLAGYRLISRRQDFSGPTSPGPARVSGFA